MSKLKYVLIGIFLVVLLVIWYFNISLTSLPTAFTQVFEDNLPIGETIEQVASIEIRQGGIVTEDFEYIAPENGSTLILENTDEINRILESNLRVYNGGRIGNTKTDVYTLFVHFEDGVEQQYNIAKEYIVASIPNNYRQFKVLNEDNDVYDYLESLYSK